MNALADAQPHACPTAVTGVFRSSHDQGVVQAQLGRHWERSCRGRSGTTSTGCVRWRLPADPDPPASGCPRDRSGTCARWRSAGARWVWSSSAVAGDRSGVDRGARRAVAPALECPAGDRACKPGSALAAAGVDDLMIVVPVGVNLPTGAQPLGAGGAPGTWRTSVICWPVNGSRTDRWVAMLVG
jgi:hypothetical protein